MKFEFKEKQQYKHINFSVKKIIMYNRITYNNNMSFLCYSWETNVNKTLWLKRQRNTKVLLNTFEKSFLSTDSWLKYGNEIKYT